MVLQLWLSEEQLRSWGWRIPFVLGAALALIALWLRNNLYQSVSEDNRQQKSGLVSLFRQHWRPFFQVIGFSASGSLSSYTFTVYMQKYLVEH